MEIVRADLAQADHGDAVVAMLNGYAADPMGRGRPLSDAVRGRLLEGLRSHPTTVIFLAMERSIPHGIAVCFRGFSTFAAKPLINLHDLYVAAPARGTGLARRLLERVERHAVETGCCKVTLEVQEGNARARGLYERVGFAPAEYAQGAGGALFMSKQVVMK